MDPVQWTNAAYLLLACYMLCNRRKHGELVFLVFLTSVLHHAFPYNMQLQRVDGIVACTTLFFIIPHYLLSRRYQKKNSVLTCWKFWLSCELFIASLYFYVSSGNDPSVQNYVTNHSLWHITSALALFVMLFEQKLQKSNNDFTGKVLSSF